MACTLKHDLDWEQVQSDLASLAKRLPAAAYVYGIPRGGAVLVHLLTYLRPDLRIDYTPRSDSFIIDDVIESGTTLAAFEHQRKLALYGKQLRMPAHHESNVLHLCVCNIYIRFPWESKKETYEPRSR